MFHPFGKAGLVHLELVGGQQVVDGHLEQMRILGGGVAIPTLEVGGAGHLGGKHTVVEGPRPVVFVVEAATTAAGRQVAGLVAHRIVDCEERVGSIGPLIADQPMVDEQLAGSFRVMAVERHGAVGDDREAEEADGFGRHRPSGSVVPLFGADLGRSEVGGGCFHPLRVDRSDDAGPQPGGLDERGRNDPVRLGVEAHRSGLDGESGRPGSEILVRPVEAHADLGQEAGEDGAVDVLAGVVAAGSVSDVEVAAVGHAQAELVTGVTQLFDRVEPLDHSLTVEEAVAAPSGELASSEVASCFGACVPEVEEGEEVASFVGEHGVGGVGRLLLLPGAFPGILHGEGCRDHDRLAETAVLVAAEDHAAEARIDG